MSYKLNLVLDLKPVRFPKKPSFNDILMMLEERNREKRPEKFIQSRSIHVESDDLPELELDSFFLSAKQTYIS